MVLIIGLISFGVSVSVFGLGFLFFRFSVSAKNFHFGASLIQSKTTITNELAEHSTGQQSTGL